MPRALTYEEKRERNLLRKAERDNPTFESTPAEDGSLRKRRNVFNGTEAKISVRQAIFGYHLHVFTDTGGPRRKNQVSGQPPRNGK